MRPFRAAIAQWVGICIAGLLPSQVKAEQQNTWAAPLQIRGVTLAPIEDARLGSVGYGSEPCAGALVEAAALGATWVSLTPFGRMDDLNDCDILPDFEIPAQKNELLIRQTAAWARALGLKIAVIPHVYVMSGQWRGEIDLGSDERWEQWFQNYERFVLRFAALAEDIDADLFSIGVEFKSSSNFRAPRWKALIAKVREVYSGLLTYSANWDEVDAVEFWDHLDFIGINAFWPWAEKPGDGFDTMQRRAKAIADDLEALALRWYRPVIFTEFGIKSARDSALAPWEWPEQCSNLIYDEGYQAAAYQAVLSVFGPKAWFSGLFIWKLFADPEDTTQEEKTGFSPRSKQAWQVLTDWFSSDWLPTSLYLFF